MSDRFRLDEGRAWVGERAMPEVTEIRRFDHVAEVGDERMEIRLRGFSVPGENGWTVSVSWNSAPNEVGPFDESPERALLTVTNRDERIVVWDETGEPAGRSLDHVGGKEVDVAEALSIIDLVSSWPSDHLPIIDRS